MTQNPLTDDQNPLLPMAVMVLIAALVVAIGIPKADPATARVLPTPTVEAAAVVAAAPELPTPMPTPEDHRLLMAMGMVEVNASAVQLGQRTYNTACTACHGLDARGISGLGKTLIGSPFVDSLHDDQLVAFLIAGRTSSDPLNTTGMPMPARGGNPSLTDADLHNVVDYIRSLNGATVIADNVDTVAAPPAEVRPFEPLDINSLPDGLITASYVSTQGQPLDAWLKENFPFALEGEVTMTAEEWAAFVDYIYQR